MDLPFHITLAADIGDFVWLIFIIIMVVGSVISSIFKAIKESAEKNRRRQMAEREAGQVGGQSPRTASQRIQELAEQRRKQLEQMAAERRRQLEEMARQRQSSGSAPGRGGATSTAAPARPLPSVESDYDRQMRERQEAARRHQQELERRREQERAAAQQRQQELERRRGRPRPRTAAPPVQAPAQPVGPRPVQQEYRPLELAEEITADMIVREDAPGHEESVHRHVADAAEPGARAKARTPVPRLDHPIRLRQAVMIKEILDRPLALRDGEHDPFSW